MTRILRRCELCETALEFQLSDGWIVQFTAHDDAFCRAAAKERIEGLNRALERKDEIWQRASEAFCRRVEKLLERHGLPTLDELGMSVEREVLVLSLLQELGSPVTVEQLRAELGGDTP